MADRIEQIAGTDTQTRALIEEGLREQYQASSFPSSPMGMHTVATKKSEKNTNSLFLH